MPLKKQPERVLVAIGTLMFAAAAKMDLVRLAIPRRVYHVVEVILHVWKNREKISGMRFGYQAPFLRHFTAHLQPLAVAAASF